jgi:quercetin dioxygenase-like cupin family protein
MEYAAGNVFIREGRLDLGNKMEGHEHNFDHVTYIAKGSAKVQKLDASDNVVSEVTKSASQGQNWVLILAGVRHRITALEDGTVYHCIYAHRSPQGDVVQEWDGWGKAYE